MRNGFVLVATLFALTVSAASSLHAAEERPSGEPFFAATLVDTQLRPATVAELRGKPVIVNFWATWCTPCRSEIPALDDAHENGKSKGLAVVGIALDDDAAAVRAFVSGQDIGYTMLTGKEQAQALMRQLGNDKTALPFTVAIDRGGNIVARKFGILRRGDLERMLAASLGRGDPPRLAYRP